jgi:nucleoside-diphosphate-sugar epimerase
VPPATTFGYVHVEDLVDAVLASLASDDRTCNVVGGHTTFGDYLAALRSCAPRATDGGGEPGHPLARPVRRPPAGRGARRHPLAPLRGVMAFEEAWWTRS